MANSLASASAATASTASPAAPGVGHDTSLRQRRKPHILPPLETRRAAEVGRAEVGSPTPKWRAPTAEEQLLLEERPTDGKPAIRLTGCTPDPKTSPPPPPSSLHIASRYAPLEPIRRKDSKPA